ncbi:MAG: division/cell wall cluster transcriptional repressor MraZ [Chloroflexota bacterium]
MFIGEYHYKVDAKGRLPIPPHFRGELQNGLVLSRGIEQCLVVYSPTEWKNLASSMATTGSITPDKMRRLNRYVFATAFSLNIDSQGRIALPPVLREYADIGNEVIIAGVNSYLELWNRGIWEEEKARSQEQAWQIIESLEK